jgi:hypothetical protein
MRWIVRSARDAKKYGPEIFRGDNRKIERGALGPPN